MSGRSRVFIAGAGGFIGCALGTWLESHGIVVFGADKQVTDGVAKVQPVDLVDLTAVTGMLKHCAPDVIFHVAGAVGTRDESLLEQVHIVTTRTLLLAARSACPTARVVVFGSAAEYGSRALETGRITEDALPQPDSAYGRSKLMQSELARMMGSELNLDVIRVRLFNTLGPGQGTQLVAGAMVQRLYQTLAQGGERFEVYDPDSKRDYLDVRDVVRLVWIVATHTPRDVSHPPIQIASGEGVTVRELAGALLRASNVADRVQPVWIPAARLTSSVGEPSTLWQMLGHEAIRQIRMSDSLRDMWAWQVRQDTHGSQS